MTRANSLAAGRSQPHNGYAVISAIINVHTIFFYEILGGAHLSETEDRGLVYVEQLVLERF